MDLTLRLASLLACALLICTRADGITIATGEFPPWTSEQLAGGGCINAIVKEAFLSQGIDVVFVYRPWKRAFEETKQGRFDATSYWYASAERLESMLASDPLVRNQTVFFQRSDDPIIHWRYPSDLAEYRLGATIGFSYTEGFHEAIDKGVINPVMVPNDHQNLKMLLSKRIDLFATDKISGLYLAKSLNIPVRKLRVITPELSDAEGFLMLPKSKSASENLRKTFNNGLRQLKLSGKYQVLLNSECDEKSLTPANTNSSKQQLK